MDIWTLNWLVTECWIASESESVVNLKCDWSEIRWFSVIDLGRRLLFVDFSLSVCLSVSLASKIHWIWELRGDIELSYTAAIRLCLRFLCLFNDAYLASSDLWPDGHDWSSRRFGWFLVYCAFFEWSVSREGTQGRFCAEGPRFAWTSISRWFNGFSSF